MRCVLGKDIFYRKYKDEVILYETENKKVFVLNAFSYEVLNYFKDYIEVETVVEKLIGKYNLQDSKDNLYEFINSLISKGILIEEKNLEFEVQNIEHKYYSKNLESDELTSVLIELTFNCNEKCKHCYCCVDDSKTELNTIEVKYLLKELREMGVLDIIFTGGDLFTRTDTFEILNYAYDLGFLITIFTNGIALKDSDLFSLKSIYPKAVHFSVYSHIPEKHDYITQVNGSYNKTIEIIKKCVLLKIPVNIKVPVLSTNCNEIDELSKLAISLGTTIQFGMTISPTNNGGKEPFEFRMQNDEDYYKAFASINKNLKYKCNDSLVSEDSKICGAGRHSISINPYGEVYPCNSLLISCGNIREKNIKDIWSQSNILKEIRKITMGNIKGCESCQNKNKCFYCMGEALLETGDYLSKYDEACRLTKASLYSLERKKQNEY